jgi:hypothetical protein
MTNFENGVSAYGVPLFGGSFVTQGKAIFVKPSSGLDGNDGLTPATAVKTLVKAKELATANKNDVVYFFSESNTASSTTDYQSSALDWSKDGVHLIGCNNGVMIGSRSRIAQTSTVKTIEDLFTVSADNCLIANMEVFQGVASGTASAPRAVVVSGQRNRFVNCQLSGIGDTSADVAGARSLVVTGAENQLENCYIGLDTVIRGTALGEMEVTASAGRLVMKNCIVNSYTSLSTFKAILMNTVGSSAHAVTFLVNCMLCAEGNRTDAVAPTGAIIFTYAGNVFMKGTGVFGYADVSTLDNANILVYGSSNASLVGMGLAGSVDVA